MKAFVVALVAALLALASPATAFAPLFSQHRHARVVPMPVPSSSTHPQSTKPSVLLTSPAQTPYETVRGMPYHVWYDERAFTINGARVLLLSGSVHYPRSTPTIWPQLMASARAAGLNTIQTYVFWNEHEDIKGTLDFETESRNLREFLQAAKDAGLFVNLRIGPYVCAEWYYGGLPLWLRDDSDIQLRYYDPLWLEPVEAFIRYVTKYVEPYLPRNGGNIILAQIENEYGSAGSDPKRIEYVQWCANLTIDVAIDIPWVMCQQPDAPLPTVYTCNGFYCDWYVDAQQQKGLPAGWTEDWPGWFQDWTQAKPRRPVEDVAFAMTKFIAAGGTLHNYYMWHGGTNWGKRQGGPGITQTYDYDAPIDEYGIPHSPKYDHLAENHQSLNVYAAALLTNPHAKPVDLGNGCQSYTYNGTGTANGVVFLANNNNDWSKTCTVTVSGASFTLPAWSVSIVDANTLQVVFNTHTLSAATLAAGQAYEAAIAKPIISNAATSIAMLAEPVAPYTGATILTANTPLEQLTTTHYQSTYFYYMTNFTLTSSQIKAGSVLLTLSNIGDYFYVWLNNRYLFYSSGIDNNQDFKIDVSGLQAGIQTLKICNELLGVTNGANADYTEMKGIRGNVSIDNQSLVNGGQQWQHIVGLWGEQQAVYDPANAGQYKWLPTTNTTANTFTWYQLAIPTPAVSNPSTATYYLRLDSLAKGKIYVNGYFVGPFWNVMVPSTGCDPCENYVGNYDSSHCRWDCGKPSQSQYHVPRDVLMLSTDGVQRVVIFNEQGGDLSQVTLNQRN